MLFIDLRSCANGGDCAADPSVWDQRTLLDEAAFAERVRGRQLIVVTHGFNVNRANGMLALGRWCALMQLPEDCLCVGVLWPGDARLLHVLDYPFEGSEAVAAGKLLARFLNTHAAGAASLSLVSHSLGARVVLQALQDLAGGVRRLVLMAAAIEDDCLHQEYRAAAAKAQSIHVLASKEDWVLAGAFPLGNVIGEIVMRGHPYFKTALGRDGPDRRSDVCASGGVWELPDGWNYGHLDYLPGSEGYAPFAGSVGAPAASAPVPAADPWKASWSAAFVSSLVR
jgi:pimeloyl-ACP methyl ester carboxylesterase